MPHSFNPSRARSFAALLSRPRGCGTNEERWAANEIRGAFREAGLETEEEFFRFRPSGDAVVRIVLLLALASLGMVVAGGCGVRGMLPAGLASLVLLAILGPRLAATLLLWNAVDPAASDASNPHWLGTSNVVGRAPGPQGSPRVVFVAHYDSKSQNMSITVRITCFVALALAGLATVVLAILGAFGGLTSPIPILVVAGVALAAALPIFFLRTGNASPGALDNACGVGTLVELARLWRDHPLSGRCRAWVVSPSAEEHGLIGSRMFVMRHGHELKEEPRCWVLNLDGCATGGTLLVLPSWGRASGGSFAARALIDAARSVGARVRGIPVGIGLLADHVPFIEAGLSCASLLGAGAGTSRIHTPGDEASLLSDEGFAVAGATVLGAVERLVNGAS